MKCLFHQNEYIFGNIRFFSLLLPRQFSFFVRLKKVNLHSNRRGEHSTTAVQWPLFLKWMLGRFDFSFCKRNFSSANICRFHWIASYCSNILSWMESTQNSSVKYIGMLPNARCSEEEKKKKTVKKNFNFFLQENDATMVITTAEMNAKLKAFDDLYILNGV